MGVMSELEEENRVVRVANHKDLHTHAHTKERNKRNFVTLFKELGNPRE